MKYIVTSYKQSGNIQIITFGPKNPILLFLLGAKEVFRQKGVYFFRTVDDGKFVTDDEQKFLQAYMDIKNGFPPG